MRFVWITSRGAMILLEDPRTGEMSVEAFKSLENIDQSVQALMERPSSMTQLRTGKLPGVSPNSWTLGAVDPKRLSTWPPQNMASAPTAAGTVARSIAFFAMSMSMFLRR